MAFTDFWPLRLLAERRRAREAAREENSSIPAHELDRAKDRLAELRAAVREKKRGGGRAHS